MLMKVYDVPSMLDEVMQHVQLARVWHMSVESHARAQQNCSAWLVDTDPGPWKCGA